MSPLNKQATSPIEQMSKAGHQSWQDITSHALTNLVNPPETNRHSCYSSLVGSLLFMKTDPSVIETLLFWSNEHSDNPLSSDELQRTIRSVSRTAERRQQIND
ncbi:MAG: primase C-terminal domain-containing protein [Oenococcus oeni]